MKSCVYSWSLFLQRKYHTILLILFVVTGSLLGMLCAVTSRSILDSMMRGCAYASVSIVRMVFAVLLPFAAVILAALYSKCSALFPICFFKFFSFCFCMMGIRLAYGSAGWMLCGLLMLSDAVSVLLLFRLSLRHINGFLPTFGSELLLSILLILGISLLDYIYIAPFLARVINN